MAGTRVCGGLCSGALVGLLKFLLPIGDGVHGACGWRSDRAAPCDFSSDVSGLHHV
jgi:hypothetical protein